jgi:hypothetical protein
MMNIVSAMMNILGDSVSVTSIVSAKPKKTFRLPCNLVSSQFDILYENSDNPITAAVMVA